VCRILPVLILAAIASGCASKQRLGEYDFRNKTISASSFGPSAPQIRFEAVVDSAQGGAVIDRVVATGARLALAGSLLHAEGRLHEAAVLADVTSRIEQRTHERAARHLRATAVDMRGNNADFELELRVIRYGIEMRRGATAQFHMDAEMMLMDGNTGRRIWRSRLRLVEPMLTAGAGDDAVNSAVTAAVLVQMSVPEMERALSLLADRASDALTDRLIRGLDKARR
jgi:hypothetical protein